MPLKFIKNLFGGGEAKKEVLVVSGNADERRSLRLYLEHLKWDVRAAESVEEAERMLAKCVNLEVIFAAVKIGKDSGVQFVRTVRKPKKFRKVAAVLVTTYVTEDDQLKIRQMLDRSALIATPFSSRAIAEAVDLATNSGQGSQRLAAVGD